MKNMNKTFDPHPNPTHFRCLATLTPSFGGGNFFKKIYPNMHTKYSTRCADHFEDLYQPPNYDAHQRHCHVDHLFDLC